MESLLIINMLRALGHETRWAVYQLLAGYGDDGLSAGAIIEALQLAPATLSFHLRELSHATLVRARHQGRFIYYRADSGTMEQLVDHLARSCHAPDVWSPERIPVGPRGTKPTVRPKTRPA
jgi:ArsR family transcriptional regulator, arsenate/arsenite/antimonite-responsive transcriptional repressor